MADQVSTFVIFGASGDLATKKTYPSVFYLFRDNYLSADARVFGYARSQLSRPDFETHISKSIKATPDVLSRFISVNSYVNGAYDQDDGFLRLKAEIEKHEQENCNGRANRVFYFALPPSTFAPVAAMIKKHLYSTNGWNRNIIEKPFGKDLDSSNVLSDQLAKLFREDEIYRIDHYLGKEMVKALMILRFANSFFSAIWSNKYIHNVQITFKEPFGTEGRGGYFNEFGIMRDVMQNHLLQVLCLVAMEKPVSLDAEAIRDEKVHLLRCIPPVEPKNVVLGQYVASADGKKPGYLDDKTVPAGSKCPTYAVAALHINNERWDGVPFILKCGKALNERKAEVRIQLRDVPGSIYPELARNELVIRLQPNEAIYLKMNNKQPGLSNDPIITELDLSYTSRYPVAYIPEAYEALILDCLRGDRSNFVRSDELAAAWKIFTPILHQIDAGNLPVDSYEYGSRGPARGNEFVEKFGYVRYPEYEWPVATTLKK